LLLFYFLRLLIFPKQEQSVRSFEAMQVRNTLSEILEDLGQLPATMLYDHPTVVSLADWLLQLAGVGEMNIPKVRAKFIIKEREIRK
jgi:hypothetical protein